MGTSNYHRQWSEDGYRDTRKTSLPSGRPAIYAALVTFPAHLVAGLARLLPYATGANATFRLALPVIGATLTTVGAGRSLVIDRRWYPAGAETFAIGMFAAPVELAAGVALRGFA